MYATSAHMPEALQLPKPEALIAPAPLPPISVPRQLGASGVAAEVDGAPVLRLNASVFGGLIVSGFQASCTKPSGHKYRYTPKLIKKSSNAPERVYDDVMQAEADSFNGLGASVALTKRQKDVASHLGRRCSSKNAATGKNKAKTHASFHFSRIESVQGIGQGGNITITCLDGTTRQLPIEPVNSGSGPTHSKANYNAIFKGFSAATKRRVVRNALKAVKTQASAAQAEARAGLISLAKEQVSAAIAPGFGGDAHVSFADDMCTQPNLAP